MALVVDCVNGETSSLLDNPEDCNGEINGGNTLTGKSQKTLDLIDYVREWTRLMLTQEIHVTQDRNSWQRIVQQAAGLSGS